MTFGLCVREQYEDDKDDKQFQYGVIVTTRLPCIGRLCPYISEHGVLSVQSHINEEFGERAIRLLEEGLTIGDAIDSLLHIDGASDQLQIHGLDGESTYTYSGDGCRDWYGHTSGKNYTVAGNLLVGRDVINATEDAYTRGDPGAPLPNRLIDALEAGHDEGGDKRETLNVQSVVLVLKNTENQDSSRAYYNYYRDLEFHIDASESPFEDLRQSFELAKEGFEMASNRYQSK